MRRRSGGGDGSTDWAPAAEVGCDHRVEPEDRRVHRDGVDFLEMRNQPGDRASHGYTGHRDRAGLRPQPSHDGTQVQAVGDEIEVGLDLGLGRHRLGPHPLLLDLIGEAVGVFDALDITPRHRDTG